VKAAEQGTSVSALVKRFLTELASSESQVERLKREERELRERISSFRAADRLSRDNIHRRE
jgi:phage shock protein A